MKKAIWFVLVALLAISGCDKNDNTILLFSVVDDKKLGLQVSQEIANDPAYTILSRTQYTEAYQYLDALVLEILDGGEIAYRDEFAWEIHILEDDNTLNAFATPGGYIYVYTGLIKYLDNVDALAGVMGHEIAHADLRHTSRTMQKQYGVSLLLSVILGNEAGQLAQMAAQLAGNAAGLKFSRSHETESDERSVEYLATTQYACDGAKLFFQKIEASGQGGGTPQFLSTHPSPANRIANIEAKATEEGCDTQQVANSGYAAFQASLP
mgnify:CR=1 FL=1